MASMTKKENLLKILIFIIEWEMRKTGMKNYLS